MATQVVFLADKELKDQTLLKARSEGITLKAFLVSCMKSYVDGKLHMGIHPVDEPAVELLEVDDSIQQKMDTIALKWRRRCYAS